MPDFGGTGVNWIAHRVPFHFSASGSGTRVAGLVPEPTAKQVVIVGQDTDTSSLSSTFATFGVGWMTQVAAAPGSPAPSVAAHPTAAAKMAARRLMPAPSPGRLPRPCAPGMRTVSARYRNATKEYRGNQAKAQVTGLGGGQARGTATGGGTIASGG
jgi:hypothetical protein